MAVMFAARGCDRLIIVDACRSGAEPLAAFEPALRRVFARKPFGDHVGSV
jgi:Ni,Fe-hydrogenase maturation factor